jgi:hypothetical protein
VIDCTPAQHAHLQKLIKESLSSGDWKSPRPELGQGIALEGLPAWDFGVYQSELSNKLIDDRTGNGTLERACVVGNLVRTKHHIFSSPIAWAMTAEASGLGAGRFEGYKLGYTGGLNPDADKDAIEGAATQPEGVVSLSRIKKKPAVARVLNIPTAPTGHIYKKGAFKRKFDELFPPIAQ